MEQLLYILAFNLVNCQKGNNFSVKFSKHLCTLTIPGKHKNAHKRICTPYSLWRISRNYPPAFILPPLDYLLSLSSHNWRLGFHLIPLVLKTTWKPPCCWGHPYNGLGWLVWSKLAPSCPVVSSLPKILHIYTWLNNNTTSPPSWTNELFSLEPRKPAQCEPVFAPQLVVVACKPRLSPLSLPSHHLIWWISGNKLIGHSTQP